MSRISAESRIQLRRDLGIGRDKTIACFVGRLGTEKSVDVLLKYWQQSIRPEDNLHLLIIGEGPARQELMALAKELGIENMVTFTGKIMHDELPPYYSICSIYVTASLSDTNSISMKEGMAAGLPVVHIKDELNKGQVVHGVNGYIYENAEQFGHYLRLLRDMNQADLDEMKARVLALVRRASDVVLASTLLDVYAEAAEHLKLRLSKKEERSRRERDRARARRKKGCTRKTGKKKRGGLVLLFFLFLRQLEPEGAALSFCTVHPEFRPMQNQYVFDNGQPKACSNHPAFMRLAGFVVTVPDGLLLLLRDALARISDREAALARLLPDADGDGPVVPRVIGCIAHKVVNDLLQLGHIRAHTDVFLQ